ncbi:MAG: exodeoxyribonuclease VII large subunit [Thermoplasmata archaeon]|nr:exodeoxyribonuclease VII large subunit [Thermoplasmata archaeon]
MDPLTVSEVSRIVKDTLRAQPELEDIAVRGEVTNYADRGHHYFSIKDDKSQLKCVIWKSAAYNIEGLPLQNGAKVVVWGSIDTYPGQSTYQLNVIRCIPEGRGELFKKFLELKQKLLDEGLFAAEAKVPIPMFPEKVGIVTSEKGAALQDMVRVFMAGPGVEILTFDARVQGEGSAASIAQGIKALDGKVDLIIIGRGGGSIEDLWAFNEEVLARAVFGCNTPIISAVGHEVDEVITDYVADRRASTPTAAAEIVVQNMQSVIDEKESLAEKISVSMADIIRNSRQSIDSLDMAMWRKLIDSGLENSRSSVKGLEAGFGYAVISHIARARKSLDARETDLRTTWVAALKEKGLAALYQDGNRVTDASKFKKGQFTGLMRDGKITGEVKDIEV